MGKAALAVICLLVGIFVGGVLAQITQFGKHEMYLPENGQTFEFEADPGTNFDIVSFATDHGRQSIQTEYVEFVYDVGPGFTEYVVEVLVWGRNRFEIHLRQPPTGP